VEAFLPSLSIQVDQAVYQSFLLLDVSLSF
jgi:hypothetical protein